MNILSRREMIRRSGIGFGTAALGSLLADSAAGERKSPMAPQPPHFTPKAKRVIHLFMNGGPSHVDTFDPKPALAKNAGKELPFNLPTERKTGAAFPSPYRFNKFGESGTEVSEIFPHVAQCVDDIAVIRSMHADVPNHEPSLLLMNCGAARLIRPSVGSWLTYGLGTENENLPAFIAMCPGGYPIQESQNWQAGFLPGIYQGTYVDTKHREVEKLIEHIRNPSTSANAQQRQLNLLRELNQAHLNERGADAALEARIESFELAFRMQSEASEAFDISREPESIRKMYGRGTQARQILIARRLLQRGVRYVQVWHGQGQPWDNHDDIEKNHRKLARQCDQAIGALLKDLKQQGMLDDTLVIWGGEFGRTPTVELPKEGANQGKINGRDHNHHGFTMWLAGGGIKGGTVYGATDDFGFQAVEKRMHVHDLHATMLHLLGFDHEQFTYRYAGRDFRLTDVHGRVIHDILA
ncbi:MAG: sulfatase [Planctomycetaceae bacterium]|nr:sulfatase [Planctomycetaceae bacterium]